ncbi:uncharacterized protein VICG_01911 [Vittaforma corneae ATCC 50505]|uniref:Uncharacterized protein n=1 Tax=Vittaforma corneae (strain ATCC 50505) TaxID=993615 RepID=L2GK74_VITCO|nr:uncharacterized protein VICG_01911 [Vittaforma corneae ATCC 50505]ELA41029.1 hypothetical protein VICG_01911 [Vittaforma corneae ATCC 50505]
MPIIDLLQTFTSKQTQIFSAFLNSYSELRQMKNVNKNLTLMAQCMLNEYNQGFSKCLNHYLTNEIDKLVLQLHQQVDLEPFYCSLIPLCTEEYLQSDFFRSVWKYGNFYNLAKLYAEKCVALKIFNYEFGAWVIENFVLMKESVVILCESVDYLKLFRDIGLDFILINRINSLIKNADESGIDLLDFLVYYADKTSFDLLESIEIKLEGTSKACKNSKSKDDDLARNSLIYNIKPFEYKATEKECIKMDTPVSSDTFPNPQSESEFSATSFLFMIYKRIKSVVIRQKVIVEATNLVKNSLIDSKIMIDLLLEFIKIDYCSVFGMLNEFQESVWEPYQIVEIMTGTDISKSIGDIDKLNNFGNVNISDDFSYTQPNNDDVYAENESLSNISNITQCSSNSLTENKEKQPIHAFNVKDAFGISSIDPLIITFGDVDSVKGGSSNRFFTHILPTLKSVLNDESLISIALKSKFTKLKYLKNSVLFSVLKDKAADVRVFALMLFFNEALILNHFEEIIAKIEKKNEFIKLVLSKIMHDEVAK